MKKVLISILIVLLIVLAYFTIFKGLSLGNIRILSLENIIKANDELTNKIEEVNSLIKKDYPARKEELSTSVTQLLAKKEEYFNIAKISTEGEITKANTEETYYIEFLWTKVGRHATSKGVNIKMDVNSTDATESNMKNLAFNVNGQYIGIIQFISALENDDKLNFKIEDFKMTKGGTNLTATFNVKNIRIKTEDTSNSNGGTTQNNNQAIQDNNQVVQNNNQVTQNNNQTIQNNNKTINTQNTQANIKNNIESVKNTTENTES